MVSNSDTLDYYKQPSLCSNTSIFLKFPPLMLASPSLCYLPKTANRHWIVQLQTSHVVSCKRTFPLSMSPSNSQVPHSFPNNHVLDRISGRSCMSMHGTSMTSSIRNALWDKSAGYVDLSDVELRLRELAKKGTTRNSAIYLVWRFLGFPRVARSLLLWHSTTLSINRRCTCHYTAYPARRYCGGATFLAPDTVTYTLQSRHSTITRRIVIAK
jgi:hypothetical protein